MTEMERIDTKISAGRQLELNQQQRDLLVARARRERSDYFVYVARKIARGLRQLLGSARSARTKTPVPGQSPAGTGSPGQTAPDTTMATSPRPAAAPSRSAQEVLQP